MLKFNFDAQPDTSIALKGSFTEPGKVLPGEKYTESTARGIVENYAERNLGISRAELDTMPLDEARALTEMLNMDRTGDRVALPKITVEEK